MSDLVERLRWRATHTSTPEATTPQLCAEAAARIERLEKALRDVLSYVPHGDMPVTIYDNARAALEGK